MIYALDTNIVSYLMRDEGNTRQNYAKEILQYGNSYAIPAAVFYEVRRWLLYKPNKELKNFINEFNVLINGADGSVEMPFSIWEKAVDVYIALQSKGQLIGDADILIAAYCLVNNYTLVTRNIDDFSRIDSLKIVNWYD